MRWRRYDTMFMRLFVAMATIMLVVHLVGHLVIESLYPRAGRPHHAPPHRASLGAMPGRPAQTGAAASRSAGQDQDAMPRAGRAGGPGMPRAPGGWGPPRIVLISQLVAIIAAAWGGARLLARPVQRLARSARSLAQDVHAAPLDEARGPAEARQAAQAFNQMQQRIQLQLAQQARFLAAVSHDLRTPLTRMRLRLERVAEGPVRERLGADVTEMNALIDATLGFLRERDGAAGPRQRVDIDALVQAIVDDAAEMGQPVEVTGTAAPLSAYPAELRRALVNLIENAHRYAGMAHLVLQDTPDSLIIDVCDDGPGIPVEELDRVLEPFYRVESSRSRDTGGVGMGLAIAADIVARHGGELTLANQPEGGLRARMRLPRH